MAISKFSYEYYKRFVRFIHNRLFYNNFYVRGLENIPQDDSLVIIACNHQNCANDPIAIILSLPPSERPYAFARGDVFRKNRLMDAYFRWIGMIPIFRLDYDGEASLNRNDDCFRDAEDKLLKRHKVIIFPEATHMHGHFLGRFSLGYLNFAFRVAKNNNFEKDIKILPCSNHYSAYHGQGNDLIIQYGKPISLKPFYDLYKIKPRTTQRAVNALVRDAIKKMMLDIDDEQNYKNIEFIRKSQVGDIFAEKLDKNFLYFPDKKDSDKQLVSILSYYKEHHPEIIDEIYSLSDQVEEKEKKLSITENQMKRNPNWMRFSLKLLRGLFLLPVFLYSFIQCGLLYFLPFALVKNDKMFFNSILFIGGFVVLGPLFLLLSTLILGEMTNWQTALVWFFSFPVSLIFFSQFTKYGINLLHDWKYLVHPHKVRRLKEIREIWIENTLNILNTKIK